MKKYFFTVIISLALSTLFNCAFSQADHPLPAMFVDKKTSNEWKLRFFELPGSKYQKLSTIVHQDLSFIYSRKAVDGLIAIINNGSDVTGIRIYFARNTTCEFSNLPGNIKDDKVILLFTAGHKKGVKPDRYFFLNENGIDDKVYEINIECAVQWIKDYEETVEPELRKTLSQFPTDPDNEDDQTGVYSDTRSIFYTKTDIDQAFTAEEGYQHIQPGEAATPTTPATPDVPLTISAYMLSFSAYGPKGNGHLVDPFYKNRLFVQFDYMYTTATGDKEILYLDDMKHFGERPTKLKAKKSKVVAKNKLKTVTKKEKKSVDEFTDIVGKKALDNGLLCPTHCP